MLDSFHFSMACLFGLGVGLGLLVAIFLGWWVWGFLWYPPRRWAVCRFGLAPHTFVTVDNQLADPSWDDCICVHCGRLHYGQQNYLQSLTRLHEHLQDLSLVRTLHDVETRL